MLRSLKGNDLRLPPSLLKICEIKMEPENPNLALPVAAETPLKEMVVEYIGKKCAPEDGGVTVQMAVDIFAVEFPEFLMAVAEENFLRGYQQAMDDIEDPSSLFKANTPQDTSND